MEIFRRLFSPLCPSTPVPEVQDEPEVELSEHLAAVCEQMEYYFSNANVEGDSFMKKLIAEREDRFVPASIFLKFSLIKQMGATEDDILTACDASSKLDANFTEKMIRSKEPFVSDPRREFRTLNYQGFDENDTLQTLKALFKGCEINALSIRMRKQSRKGNDKYFTGKVDVEVATEEEAKRAVEEGIIYNGKKIIPTLVSDLKKKAEGKRSPRRK